MSSVARRFSAWYFVVPIVSIGLLAVVPFVHAAVRLRRRPAWTLAAIYGAVDVVLLTLSGLAPTDGDGNATSATGEALLSVAAIGGLATAIAGTCGIDQDSADRIIDARTTRGGFSNVAEVLVLLELPTEMWDRIRNRAIVLG